MKTNTAIVNDFNYELKWLKEQVGRTPNQDDRDRIENLMIATLKVLTTSPSWSLYKNFIARNQMRSAIRERQKKFTTKKWNRMFQKLVRIAISDLEALPKRLLWVPIGKDTSSNRAAVLAKARAAKKAKAAAKAKRENGDESGDDNGGPAASIEQRDPLPAPLYSDQKTWVISGKNAPQNEKNREVSESEKITQLAIFDEGGTP